MRGIRGATTVSGNTREEIFSAVRELLTKLLADNGIVTDDIGAAIFSATGDIDAAFPAAAAREIGWESVPLFGAQEQAVDGSLARCVRVLLLVNTDKPQTAVRHVYLRGAAVLRRDLVGQK